MFFLRKPNVSGRNAKRRTSETLPPQCVVKVSCEPPKKMKRQCCFMSAVSSFGVLLIGAISISGFIISQSSSDVFSAQGFMSNMLASVNGNLKTRLDPLVLHLISGATHVRMMSLNLSLWEDISSMSRYALSFMDGYCGTRICTYFIMSNMAFDTEDVAEAGGWEAWLKEHPDDWGDDRAIGDTTFININNNWTNTTQVRTLHERGSYTNPWVYVPRSDTSFAPMLPVQVATPLPEVRTDEADYIWMTVHQMDLLPGEVRFTPVHVWTMGEPAVFAEALMPLYEYDHVSGKPGRRFGVWGVGFSLEVVADQLGELDLQGGFVFLVERDTGVLVVCSDPQERILNGNDMLMKPIDSSHQLIGAAARNLQSVGDWAGLGDTFVQGDIDGKNYFFQCFQFIHYDLDFVGVYVVPANLVLGDIAETYSLILSLFNFGCSVCLVACIFAFFCHSFRTSRRDMKLRREGFEHTVQEIALAAGLAEKLANYDLASAERFLKDHNMASNLAQPLEHLLDNLTSYSAFLPNSLFRDLHVTQADASPNTLMTETMTGRTASLHIVHACANHLRDLDYSLLEYTEDIEEAFPELSLYTTSGKLSSGLTGINEYERTLGAFYALYCILRLDLDGKQVFSFGVDATGCPRAGPQDNHAKKFDFFANMNWEGVWDLVRGADLLRTDSSGRSVLRHDRVVAMLVLTAVHDVMKNTSLTPTVLPQHAPYQGHAVDEAINDHDVALAYVLEFFPSLLPSFSCLEAGQRAPILFTQGRMGFNNGWLVQGEAPPGLLFSKFQQIITNGRASQADINFYFVHWFTDLAGAEVFDGRPWPGAEKFTTKFSVKVLGSFLDSFSYVNRLSTCSEVEVLESYLASRWAARGFSTVEADTSIVALQRLTLMAQGFEHAIVNAFRVLPVDDRSCLTEELARTGLKEQFQHAPEKVRAHVRGPALMLYYAPALLQKAGADQCLEAMMVLAAVCRAARRIFPLEATSVEQSATIRIDALKVLTPSSIVERPVWYVSRTGELDAEVVADDLPGGRDRTTPIDFDPLRMYMSLRHLNFVSIVNV